MTLICDDSIIINVNCQFYKRLRIIAQLFDKGKHIFNNTSGAVVAFILPQNKFLSYVPVNIQQADNPVSKAIDNWEQQIKSLNKSLLSLTSRLLLRN